MAVARALWLLVLVGAGCFKPAPQPGAPCAEGDRCPDGLDCINGRCELPGTMTGDAPMIDAREIDAPMTNPDAPVTLGPWGAPTPVGIEVGNSKTDPSFTANRLVVVYARNDDLFMATRQAIGGAFVIAGLDVLNDTSSEKSPEITADGRTIYFASNTSGNYDIFVSTLVNNAWTTPIAVPGWNTGSNEQDVAISPDELTAFVSISGDLRRATRNAKTDAWPAPTSLGVNWGTNATAPTINANGDVYFHANATRDLFVARKVGNGYATPVPVTELNTGGRDAAPFVAGNDRHIMFERDAELVESSR